MNYEENMKYEEVHANSDSNNTFVYRVTNNCGVNHITTFSWEVAYAKYIERLDSGDYPQIELIEVEL